MSLSKEKCLFLLIILLGQVWLRINGLNIFLIALSGVYAMHDSTFRQTKIISRNIPRCVAAKVWNFKKGCPALLQEFSNGTEKP